MSEKQESKYILVKNFYLDYINKNDLQGGELLPSEAEAAKVFKFSRDTIRRGLNELEKEGYLERERGKGTFFIKPKKKLKEKKIAVITTYVSNYIFPSIISGIEEEVSSRHYTLTFASTKNDPERERELLGNIIDSEVEGLIIEPAKSAVKPNLDLYRELDEKEIPFVMINAMYKELEPSYVIMDDCKGAYIAAKYLLQLGHQRIAGIFKKDDLQGVYRKKGFIKALREYKISLNDVLIGEYNTGDTESYTYYFTEEILKQKDRITAVLCYNEEMAMKVIDVIYNNDLKIPDDISLLTFDDSVLATTGGLRLTTIRHPKKELGKKAAQQLFNMINFTTHKPTYIYEPELVVRSSCKEI